MSLKLNFGTDATFDLDAKGDLAKHLLPGVESIVKFASTDMLDKRIADLPKEYSALSFQFSSSPSWRIDHLAAVTLSVQPEAACDISILRPGDTLYQYSSGVEAQPVSEKVPAGCYYAAITMECSIGVDGGARYSAGNFGFSGNLSVNDRFRLANYRRLQPAATLLDCLVSVFSNFALPFQVEGVMGLSDGDCVDFEFAGKLALGFGATYGFSGALLGGRSGGDVKASFGTGIANAVVTAEPSLQVGAGFKLSYSHEDAFRVIVTRISGPEGNRARLYLLRKDSSSLSTKESFGITVDAGAKFDMDAKTLRTEIQQVCQKYLGGTAVPLGDKLATSADALVDDVNSSVNQLLAKGDAQKLSLELTQSKTLDDTALFIYNFDFVPQSGRDAYGIAMRGDYATAITLQGVELDTRSFIEQTYLTSAGINLQLFDLLHFQDVTEYIEKTELAYVGARTFQLRTTEGVKAMTGLFNKTQEADLYFIAQCRNVAGSIAVSEVEVALQLVFIDRSTEGSDQTEALLAALDLGEAASAVRDWSSRNTGGSLRLTFGASAADFGALQADEYQHGHPPPEPHNYDEKNYDAFIAAFRQVIGTSNAAAQIFVDSFGRYVDWLTFNRIKTDGPGSVRPGDRNSVGNSVASLWPEGYPPADAGLRALVQVHIYAAQHFMSFCECLKHLASDLSAIETQQRYEAMLSAVRGMIRKDLPYPTYFLKPGFAAVIALLGGKIKIAGAMPNPSAVHDVALVCALGAAS